MNFNSLNIFSNNQIYSKQFFFSVLVPSFFVQFGVGMLLPIEPIFISDLNVGIALVGLGLSGILIGNTLFDIPSGIMIKKIGHDKTMLLSVFFVSISSIITGFVSSFLIFFILRIITGCGLSMWDLSRMSYDKFMDNYRKIIHKCYSKLKDNRFAGFVITELRDPKTGGYKNFLLDTITAFEDAGFVFYNDIILIQTTGTKALVAQKLWDNNRKITRRHQNFLLFIKGDGKKAKQDMSDIERINLEGSSLEEFYVG